MQFASYAQNFEDVMLMRAFADVECGTYIDVGAQDPTIDSVSRVFHERGWYGAHVEPSAHYAELLRRDRPNDLVIEAAISEHAAVVTFFEIPDSGISTTLADIAAGHRERGFEIVERQVPAIPLSAVLQRFSGRTVHWLKLDIEASERAALLSWGDDPLRPMVVVVESTLPMTQTPNHEEWEPILLAKGYEFAYFDGLNRFYVSEDARHLRDRLMSPPNVFDGFELSGTGSATFHQAIAHQRAAHVAACGELRDELQAQASVLRSDLESRLRETDATHERLLSESALERGRAATEISAARQEFAAREGELLRQVIDLQQVAMQESTAWRELLETQVADRDEQSFRQEAQAQRLLTEQRLQFEQSRTELSEILTAQLREAYRASAERIDSLTSRLRTLQDKLDLGTAARESQEAESRASRDRLASEHRDEREALAVMHAKLIDELHHRNERDREERLEQAAQVEQALQTQLAVARRRIEFIAQSRASLESEVARIRHSWSWRLTAPFRWLTHASRSTMAHDLPEHPSIDLADASVPPSGEGGAATRGRPAAAEPELGHTDPVPAARLASSRQNNNVVEDSTMPTDLTGPTTVAELLLCHDEDFVDRSYRLVLGRSPDAGGLADFLRQVRAGVAKERMVVAMATSDEGRAHGSTLPGLGQLVEGYRLNGRGRVARLARRMLGGAFEVSEAQLRVIANQLHLFECETRKTLARIEAENARSRIELVAVSERQKTQLSARIEGIENQLRAFAAQAVAPSAAREQADQKTERTEIDRVLGPRAQSVYRQLNQSLVDQAETGHANRR